MNEVLYLHIHLAYIEVALVLYFCWVFYTWQLQEDFSKDSIVKNLLTDDKCILSLHITWRLC